MNANIRNNQGFSLIELMVVMVVLTVGLLPLAIIQTRAQRDVMETGQMTEALNLAKQQIETAKAMGWNNVAADSGVVDNVYGWNRNVTEVSWGLQQVDVIVTWQESGMQRQVALTDRMSRR